MRSHQTAASNQLVVSAWRDTIEPWHYLFSDPEMSWISMVTTRDIIQFFDATSNRVDFSGAAAAMTDSTREVLPGATTEDARRIHTRVESASNSGMTVAAYAGHAAMICSRWWRCPRWLPLAEQVAKKAQAERNTDQSVGDDTLRIALQHMGARH